MLFMNSGWSTVASWFPQRMLCTIVQILQSCCRMLSRSAFIIAWAQSEISWLLISETQMQCLRWNMMLTECRRLKWILRYTKLGSMFERTPKYSTITTKRNFDRDNHPRIFPIYKIVWFGLTLIKPTDDLRHSSWDYSHPFLMYKKSKEILPNIPNFTASIP